MSIARWFGLAALAWAWFPGPALRADEGEGPPPYRYGIRFTAAMPQQDLKSIDNRTGLGLGLFAENDLGSGMVVQARVDYLRYPQANQPSAGSIADLTLPNPLTVSTDSVAVGVDVQKHLLLGGQQDLFLLVGIAGYRYEFQTSAVTQQGSAAVLTRSKDKSEITAGVDVGIGYSFAPDWALTLRYTTVAISHANLATFETGLSYRF